MTGWHLKDTVETRFGKIASGRAGSGPPLVLAHGWPWSSFAWHRIIPELAKRFTCHWYDMLGYGQSDMPDSAPTSLDIQGELFAEMIEHWQLSAPTVLAHDFGGATTLRAHLLGGVDYGRLILMNVVAVRPWGSEFFEHVRRHVEAFTGLPPHIHEAIVRAYIGGALVSDLLQEDLDALAAPWLSEEGRTSFYRQFAQADEGLTEVLEPLFGSARCSVDILWGEEDPWIPLARGEQLHRSISGSSFTALPGLGHLPQLEGPETVLDALESLVL